jgi:predicted HicB family RNase H-like nuclease
MEYKGYIGQFTFEETQELFQGKVLNIYGLVTFQGKSLETLQLSFQNAIDDYLAFCKRLGKKPKKPSLKNKKVI